MKNKESLPVGEEKRNMVKSMFDDIAPSYEKANKFISLGMDKHSRKIAIKALRASKNSLIIDLASGTGDLSRMLIKEGARPISCDFSYGMLDNSYGTLLSVQCDGNNMPFADNSCDGLICGYGLRNFVDLETLFIEINRVLKPGARFVAVDVSVPKNPIIRIFNKLWMFKIAPKLGKIISKNKDAYEYLPRSTSYLPSNEKIVELLKSVDHENVSVDTLIGGSLILVCSTKSVAQG
ncbi:MAG: ubiquinone/menaquinone biosynthesis methyltransferase [Acidimicrobiia bacterium]